MRPRTLLRQLRAALFALFLRARAALLVSVAAFIPGCAALTSTVAEDRVESVVDAARDLIEALRIADDLAGAYADKASSREELDAAEDVVEHLDHAFGALQTARQAMSASDYVSAFKAAKDAAKDLRMAEEKLHALGVNTRHLKSILDKVPF